MDQGGAAAGATRAEPATGSIGATTLAAPTRVDAPECDVVMKGGITSGVIYPGALAVIGSTYRLRGIGGASAGAIGAAVGAAAEFDRDGGGFDRLLNLPDQLGSGALARLFQPQRSTRPLLRLMLAATGNDSPNAAREGWRKYAAIARAALRAFPLAALLGVLPGLVLVVVGAIDGGVAGVLLMVAGAVVALLGVVVAVLVRLFRMFAVAVPGNLFGICRGLGEDPDRPGFTEWLCDRIDAVAGLATDGDPLTFGQLWAGEPDRSPPAPADRRIDLRMITTCLSEGRPYEMPWQARRFFFDPAEWRTLFPERVVHVLEGARPGEASTPGEAARIAAEDQLAAAHDPPLKRLPDPEHLPVIVATRMSLSFPLLISAVPLWSINHHDEDEQPSTEDPSFTRLWFTDGGFCSNFPVHLFDAALPSRPTFAINLGRFPQGREPDADDQTNNVEWARTNRMGLSPPYLAIPTRGIRAVTGFASAAVNTSRNWQDNSHLDHPGYRDRIVRVLQTRTEGGLNLHMDGPTIHDLTDRGQVAAEVLVQQFTEPRYPEANPVATGWDNHRWVRYRALLSVLPAWLQSYRRGRTMLDINAADPPSYRLDLDGQELAAQLADELDQLAQVAATADPATLDDLAAAPRPRGILRRIPQT